MIEEMKKAEDEVSKIINEKREKWIDKYGFAPDSSLRCFQVVELLIKLGVIKDD